MSTIKAIRQHLGLSQAALAEGLGCTQGNVWHYEKPEPQTVPPKVAERLVKLAALKGFVITMDQIYGMAPLPAEVTEPKAPENGTAA